MSRKQRKQQKPIQQKTYEQKKAMQMNVLRLLVLVALTMVVFCIYRFFTQRYSVVILIVYMALATAAILAYVIYNRGFSRRGITEDMLPDTMSAEEKAEFIEDAQQRLRKSRPLLMLIFAFAFTFIFDILELYALPLIKEMFTR